MINLFLDKYKIDASLTTVSTKAKLLASAAKVALSFYDRTGQQNEKRETARVIYNLRSISAAFKSGDRHEWKVRSAMAKRVDAGQVLVPYDFDACVN